MGKVRESVRTCVKCLKMYGKCKNMWGKCGESVGNVGEVLKNVCTCEAS